MACRDTAPNAATESSDTPMTDTARVTPVPANPDQSSGSLQSANDHLRQIWEEGKNQALAQMKGPDGRYKQPEDMTPEEMDDLLRKCVKPAALRQSTTDLSSELKPPTEKSTADSSRPGVPSAQTAGSGTSVPGPSTRTVSVKMPPRQEMRPGETPKQVFKPSQYKFDRPRMEVH